MPIKTYKSDLISLTINKVKLCTYVLFLNSVPLCANETITANQPLYNVTVTDDDEKSQSGDFYIHQSRKIVIYDANKKQNPINLLLETDIDNYGSAELNSRKKIYYNSGKWLTLDKICRVKNTKMLAFKFTGYYDGIGLPFSIAVLPNKVGFKEYALPVSSDDEIDDGRFNPGYDMTCNKSDVSELDNDGNYKQVSFCQCDFTDLEIQTQLQKTLESLIPEHDIYLNQNHELNDNNSSFDLKFLQFIPLSVKSSIFESQFELMKKHLDVTHIKLKSHEFIQIKSKNTPIYHHYSYSFIKLNNEEWQLFYSALQSSKGYFPLSGIEKVNDNELQIKEFCISDCDWWGIVKNVKIDIENQTMDVVKNRM